MLDDDAPLMLSISGARGIVGRSMTPEVVVRFAEAYATELRRDGEAAPLVCLGRDSRPSGAMLAAAALSGLLSGGCRVIDLGIVATPTVGVMIDVHGAAGGLIVTASHNPIEWNGLKCLDGDGAAPGPAAARAIIERFELGPVERAAVDALYDPQQDDRGDATHVRKVIGAVDDAAIRAAGFTVVLDSVNGAGCRSGRALLEALGCHVEHLNGEPDGRFPHPPEPVEAHLRDLARRTAERGADVGFAQDPDADRLAVVDAAGRYIGEEYTLALAARQVLARRGSGTVAANLSTSRMIDDVVARHPGSRVLRTAVGEANVVAAMASSHAILGGEGNGGVIFPPVCRVRDSLSAMALILELMAAERRPLAAIVDDLPAYAMIKLKATLGAAGGRSAIEPMLQRIAAHFATERVETIDGVRVDFADGWVHVRPSNTEPIVRLIAEATTDARARELVDVVAKVAGIEAS